MKKVPFFTVKERSDRPRDANRALVRRGRERERRRLVDHFRSVVIRRNYRYRDA